MANISALRKASYVVTQNDVDAFNFSVRVLWPSAFFDTNYSVAVSMELSSTAAASTKFTLVGISDISPAGFDLQLTAAGGAGEKIVIHAMASHR